MQPDLSLFQLKLNLSSLSQMKTFQLEGPLHVKYSTLFNDHVCPGFAHNRIFLCINPVLLLSAHPLPSVQSRLHTQDKF